MLWRRLFALTAFLGFALAGVQPAAADELLIRGTAVARDGGALEDARVLLLPMTSQREELLARLEGEERAPAAGAKLRADGRFEIVAPRVGMWRLEVRAREHVPMRFDLVPLVEENTLPKVELRRAEPIEVTVVGPGDEPVADGWVRISATDRSFWSSGRFFASRGGGWWPVNRLARTDETGTATLDRAPDEEVTVRAGAAGLVEAPKVDTRATAVTLGLAAGRSLVVRAVDVRRTPLPGALARVGDGGWPLLADDEGLVRVTVPTDDKLELTLSDAERRSYDGSVSIPAQPGPDPIALTLDEPLRLAGRVVDADSGRPLPGTLVWLSRDPTAEQETDGQGVFAVAAGGSGQVYLQAVRSGYQSAGVEVPERSPHEPVLALEPASRVRGTVVDSTGRPVEGAEIGVRVDEGGGMRMIFRGSMSSTPRARSDADGRFLITGLDPRAAYKITAKRDGFASTEIDAPELEPLATTGGVRLVLDTGARLVGRVLDGGGAPVAGARIELQPAASGGQMRMFRMMRGDADDAPEAYSDSDGAFELAHLEAKDFDLEVSAAGFATKTVPGIAVSDPGATVDAGSIVLEPGVELAGRVVDLEGQPIEDAEVWASVPNPMNRMRLRFRGGDGEPGARTAADGHFAFSDRRPGERVDLVARRSGFSAAIASGVEVPPVEPVVIELRPASSLSGRVVDSRGEPVPQARIQAFAEGGGASGGGAVFMMAIAGSAVSDQEGEFTVEDIEPGTVRLSVSAQRFRQTEESNIEVPVGEDVEGLEIELLEGASLTGRVQASNGQPVVGARVHIVEQQRQMMRGGGFGALTDGAGNYFLEGLEPGIRLIGASHDDEGDVTRETEIEEGENSLDLVFEGGFEVTGRVVDEAGGPLAGATVGISSSARFFGGGSEERAGADGSFTFRGVRDGTYRVSAFQEGYAQTAEGTEVEVAGAPVYGLEVRLGQGSVISGQIRGLEPTQLVSVDVIASSPPSRWSMGEVRHDGTYRVADVGPGDWQVVARATDGAGQAQGRVTIAEGQPEALLDLEFGGGLEVTGRVLLGTEPVQGVTVGLSGLDVQSNASGVTGRDGRFKVAGLEPGRHRLMVMDFASGLQHSEEHEIRSDVDLVVELAVSRVSGRAVDSTDSSPLAGVIVRLEPLAEQEDWARFFNRAGSTDAGGLFNIHNVSAGAYRLVAEKDGFTPGEKTLQVASDRSIENLEISLQPTDGLAMRVFLPSGGAASEVFAAVTDGGGRTVVSGRYPVDQEGRLRLSKVPPGSWRLLVGTNNTAISSLTAIAPGTAGDIRLQPEARARILIPELADDRTLVQVEVLGGDGQPAPVFSWNGRLERQRRASFGRATLTGLAAGEWLIRATAPDGRVWEKAVSLAPGANPELVLN